MSKIGAELVHLVHNSALWNQTIFVNPVKSSLRVLFSLILLAFRPSPGLLARRWLHSTIASNGLR